MKRPAGKALGRHLLIELYDCDAATVAKVPKVHDIMVKAAKACGATVVDALFHAFNPHGVSGVVVIAESHLAIHTWPEHGHASVDIYTCGRHVNPRKASATLRKAFGARRMKVVEIKRGVLARGRKTA